MRWYVYISFEQDLADGSEIQVFGIKGKQTPGRLSQKSAYYQI